MTSPLVALACFTLISLAAGAAGTCLLRRFRGPDGRLDGALASSMAVGYLLIAYLVAVVGWLGYLSVTVGAIIVATVFVAGIGGLRPFVALAWKRISYVGACLADADRVWVLLAALAVTALAICSSLFVTGIGGAALALTGAGALLVLTVLAVVRARVGIAWLLLAWCLVTLLAALAPPADNDWDGLSEHLAQAKIYATSGQYQPLWYDHHSHFPALTQMLFTLGMLFDGPGLAKLFHWAFGLLGMGAVFCIGQTHLGQGVGKWAALVYASTPLVGWLMQIGYVDLSTTAYGLLAVLAFMHWLRTRSGHALALSGFLAGGMMGTKMQGIPLMGILLIAACLICLRRGLGLRGTIRQAATFGLVAILVGGPWYAKTWVTTGNPVYPFAYGLFGGKYWGEQESRDYKYHQAEFGVGALPAARAYWKMPGYQRFIAGPRSPVSLLLAPLNLTLNPVPFTVLWRQGQRALLPTLLQFWVGPLYLVGLCVLVWQWMRNRRAWSFASEGQATHWHNAMALLALFAPLWVWWLISMQLSRYLLPSLVLLAPVVGYVINRMASAVVRALPVLWMAAALGIVCYLGAAGIAVVSGVIPGTQYLSYACPVYDASMALNNVVPENGKVALYGEPRGFYIDREYMWADPGHHRIIPYSELQTPEKLVRHLRQMGFTHVLINVRQIGNWGPEAAAPIGLLYKAQESGLATIVPEEKAMAKGYVIIDLRP